MFLKQPPRPMKCLNRDALWQYIRVHSFSKIFIPSCLKFQTLYLRTGLCFLERLVSGSVLSRPRRCRSREAPWRRDRGSGCTRGGRPGDLGAPTSLLSSVLTPRTTWVPSVRLGSVLAAASCLTVAVGSVCLTPDCLA